MAGSSRWHSLLVAALALGGPLASALLFVPVSAAAPIAPGLDYTVPSSGYHVVVADVSSGLVLVRVNKPKNAGATGDFDTVANHAQAAGALVAINANYFDAAKGGTCGLARGFGHQFTSVYKESGCRTSLGWAPGAANLFDGYGKETDVTFHPTLTEIVTGGGVLASSAPAGWPQLTMPVGRAMTALGLTPNGQQVVMVVTDKQKSSLATMKQVLADKGATEAVFLDGGGSSRMWIQGKGYVNLAEGGDRLVPVVVMALPASPSPPDGGAGQADAVDGLSPSSDRALLDSGRGENHESGRLPAEGTWPERPEEGCACSLGLEPARGRADLTLLVAAAGLALCALRRRLAAGGRRSVATKGSVALARRRPAVG